jgi:hypothetical protein
MMRSAVLSVGTKSRGGTFGEQNQEIAMTDNRKTDTSSNTQKDPDDWVSGDEPMTGAQRSYLKTLSEQAHQPDAYAEELTKAEASKRIDGLKQSLDLQ